MRLEWVPINRISRRETDVRFAPESGHSKDGEEQAVPAMISSKIGDGISRQLWRLVEGVCHAQVPRC